jgi:hypothetical protein
MLDGVHYGKNIESYKKEKNYIKRLEIVVYGCVDRNI